MAFVDTILPYLGEKAERHSVVRRSVYQTVRVIKQTKRKGWARLYDITVET